MFAVVHSLRCWILDLKVNQGMQKRLSIDKHKYHLPQNLSKDLKLWNKLF